MSKNKSYKSKIDNTDLFHDDTKGLIEKDIENTMREIDESTTEAKKEAHDHLKSNLSSEDYQLIFG